MRLTREALLKIARDTAAQRARVSRRIICIYLTGSLLREDPFIGGATDIDLIFVHDTEPERKREVIRLTEDVTLDIGHYEQEIFHQPRHLRTDPWLGSFIYNKPVVLHDTQHWFEFTQAAAGAQFFAPDYTLHRAETLAHSARQAWIDLSMEGGSHIPRLLRYLGAIEDAGNALACLSGMPLTERRFFLALPQKAQAVHHPELAGRLIALTGDPAQKLDEPWAAWQAAWKAAFLAAGKLAEHPIRLESTRWSYYHRAADALWGEHPIASLWIMLKTWALSAALLTGLAPDSPESKAWQDMLRTLKLDETAFASRLEELDQTLDLVEETLDLWGKENGASAEE